MDLSSLDVCAASNSPVPIQLVSPVDGKELGIFILVLGKDSDVVQNFSREMIDDRLRKDHRAKKRGKDTELQTTDKLQDKELDFLSVCTIGWYQITDVDGVETTKQTITYSEEELVFSKASAKELYKNLPWVATQVDDAVGDMSLFMKT